MKRSTLVPSGTLNRILQEANEAWKQCDFQKAFEIMERARRRDPGNPSILMNLGRMHGKRYDFANAEKCFDQALRIAGQRTDILVSAAQESRGFNEFNLAEHYLKIAVERKDCQPATIAMLGEIYERARRLDEARNLAARALAMDSSCGQALLLLSRLERQAGRLAEAEQRLKTFPAKAEPALRISAGYELGNVLDRLGQFDEAMQAFLAAKSLLQPHAYRAAHELKVMRGRIQHLTDHATTNRLREWAETSSQLQPLRQLALLGGHPRSGTTLLEQVLDSHPGIVSAEETEIFQNDAYGQLMRNHPDDVAMFQGLATATPQALIKSREDYFRSVNLALGQPVGQRLLIDKNPSYTFLVPALVRIFPEIKFIVALRDPRDVVLSCFMQNLPLNQVGAAFLTLASSADEYNCLMNTWRTMASRLRNPWLEVRYEDMVEDLEAVARKTLDFLGMPWDAKVLGFDEHARQKAVRSPTYADVTQPVYKRAKGRWHNYQKYLEPHLQTLEPMVKALGYE